MPVCGCGGVDGWVGSCVCIETGGDICKISVPPTLYWEPKTTPPKKNEVFLILFQNTRASNQNQEFQGRKKEDQEAQNEKQCFKRCQ